MEKTKVNAMRIALTLVDAFTDQPFGGNQAAVCVLEETLPDCLLQLIAREMNLSETAYVHRDGDHFRLRWFTPAVEVDLCGHATLAAAHVLWQLRLLDDQSMIHFQTRSGMLAARRYDANRIELDFPSVPPVACSAPEELISAIDVPVVWCGRNSMDYFIEVESEEQLRSLQPNLNAIAKLPVRGLIITARGKLGSYDFVSRFFAPAVGVNEDPVTGSAHCALAPYWMQRLAKNTFHAFQASSRGGIVDAEVVGDRVKLRGACITMGRTTMDFDPSAQINCNNAS